METLTKPVVSATDRLQQTVVALARLLDQTMSDIQMVDSELQDRLLQAIQEAESTSERRAAERLRVAVEEAEQNTRILLTEELRAQYRDQAAAQVEAARNELLSDRSQLAQELNRLKQAASEWEAERTHLFANYQRASQLLEQANEDRSRAMEDADEAAALALERQIATATDRVRREATSRWETERAELIAQRDRAVRALAERDGAHEQAITVADSVRSDLAEERDWLRQQLDQSKRVAAQLEAERNQFRDECEKSRRIAAEATSEHSRLLSEHPIDMVALYAVVDRVEELMNAISEVIDDPGTELSVVIRQNAERAELESYLRGIRFILPK